MVGADVRPQGPDEPLSVVTMPLEPFVIEDGDRLTGFSFDLWEAVARQLGVEYQRVKVSSVEELLAAVRNGQADVGIAGVSMTREREQVLDFSMPYFNAGLRTMTSTRATPTVPTLVGLVFSPVLFKVLGLSLLVLLVLAHLVWLADRGSEEIPRAYLPGIWKALWWSLATVATHEYGILGKRVATVRGTTGAEYLAEQHLTAVEVERIDDAYPLLQNDQAQAIVFDAPVLLCHAATKGQGEVQAVGPTLKDEYYGIALPAGSALR